MSTILNISAYRFVALPDAAELRPRFEQSAAAAGLKGTVLLAEEGINLFLAGIAADLRRWLAWLHEDPRFAGLVAKESWSDAVPFGKLLVKHKREIIRMNHPAIRPQQGRAPAVDAPTLARWLDAGHDDAGRPVVLLDTRNRFEVEQGRFVDAVDLQTSRFSELPDAALSRRAEFAGKTVVSYCTGGIRCEKAALFLAEAGFDNVLQLDGGILAYFEQVGGRHFEGECFVFDQRIALDPHLQVAA
ncbi:sulfurtransferase [Piscinibacter sakaiensis]|uniref:sulfurtransferase n=1 Tax=Piscinibacter sakaiensis TaxID=1547922 RepID=UPI003AAC0EAC